MRALGILFIAIALFSFALVLPFVAMTPRVADQPRAKAYLGFDLNEYPGDDVLPAFRKNFSFTGYWLGPPPGDKRTSWLGKRALLQSQGFGLVLLYTAKEIRDIKSVEVARRVATAQANDAAKLARQEGFAKGAAIFLDVEEGGRLPEPYHEYLRAWSDVLSQAGFRPGVYCSAIPVDEGGGVAIKTADDIRAHMGSRDLMFWVYYDACPPAPGCVFRSKPPSPAESGVPYAAIWQFVRSPQEKEISAGCGGYAKDGNCYIPADVSHQWFVDINSASSADPSAPR